MVKNVYLAATQLKMGKVAKKCVEYLIENLTVDNCIEFRSLPGISKNPAFVESMNQFISQHFEAVVKSPMLCSLPCFKIEVLSQSRQEAELVNPPAALRLAIQWIKKQEDLKTDRFVEKVCSGSFPYAVLYIYT